MAIVTVLFATGCTAGVPAASPATTAAESPTPVSPTPAVQEKVLITLTALRVEEGGVEREYPLAEGEQVVELFSSLGGAPTKEPFEGPYGSEGGTRYGWPGVIVSVLDADGAASLVIEARTIGDASIATAEGLAPGATREQAKSAGAFDGPDADDDGVADLLGVQPHEVPGTVSLVDPGKPGIDYVGLVLDGDTVTKILLPANDYADI
ncbi:hypothetical protein ACFVAE_06025 [Microbacterium sp. NPDC057659]|uniref:hypothetical protein n=1 Tax=Microbacterium sp. NPDC057659 TaxID=3346198 RepID=UPI00366C102B